MKHNIKIIASLARVDNHPKNDSMFKCIASVVEYDHEINIESLKYLSQKLNTESEYFNENKYTVIEFSFWDIDLHGKELINTNYLKYYKFNIFQFISDLQYNFYNNNRLTSLITNGIKNNMKIDMSTSEKREIIIGEFRYLFLNTNMQYNNIILIFNKFTWENVVTLLKSLNITIYGGNNSKRHLLSTVQVSLTKFVLLLNNMKISPNDIFSSFKDFKKIKDISAYEKYTGIEYNQLLEYNLHLLESIESRLNIISKISRLELEIESNKKNIKRRESMENYSEAFKAKKIASAQKQINNIKNEQSALNSELLKLENTIKEMIISLYKSHTVRNIYFTNNSLTINETNINIINIREYEELNITNVLISS